MEITHFSRKGQGLDAKNRSEQSSIGNTKQREKIFHEVASDIYSMHSLQFTTFKQTF